MYQYKGIALKITDGDTLIALLDLGFHVKLEAKLRLEGINAPELSSKDENEAKAAVLAREYLKSLVATGEFEAHTKRDKNDKYGRWIATVFVGGRNVNEEMIKAGHAVAKTY